MAWKSLWALVLGFAVSGLLQAIVPADAMRRVLGRSGPKQIAVATLAGAASSSCSYASAAIMRTLFRKGAALAPSLAFLFASTNLVLELGIVLLILMGWPFMAGEWIGGLVLVAVMSLLVKLTCPASLVEAARTHEEQGGGHRHESMTVEGGSWRDRLRDPRTPVVVARNFAMDLGMLWKDLAAGFLIGGALMAFVPGGWWARLFLADAPAWIRLPADAAIGPLVAMLSFVCSIGNVPLAAGLWAGGAGFGGVLAFLYADLIVLPLLDVYRRYFGWRMAAYIGAVFFATIVIASLVVGLAFEALGWVPPRDPGTRAHLADFALDYTFWLNLVFGALGLWLLIVARRQRTVTGGDHDMPARSSL